MKKNKLKLNSLKVSSFVTAQDKELMNTVKGGISTFLFCPTAQWCTADTGCNVCEGTENATNCCPPIQ